jgi:DNA-binding LacI/PurR family transcriptional regulator
MKSCSAFDCAEDDALGEVPLHQRVDHEDRDDGEDHDGHLERQSANGAVGHVGCAATGAGQGHALHPPQLQSSPGENPSTIDTVRGLLEGPTRPRVLVCATDQKALVAIDVLRDHGVDVQTQVAVTGFDGIMAGRLITPTLTTVRQPMEDIGRLAVRILLDTLAGDENADRHEILSAAVWRGGTCGCSGG